MFDHTDSVIGLLPGEGTEVSALLEAEDRLAFEVSCLEMADGWVDPERHVLPADLESIPPGPYLAAILSSVESEKLNGHDAVRVMQSRARLGSHDEAGKYEAMFQVAYAPPSDPDSGVLRSSEEVEYAAVEIAAALRLTRRASNMELSRAVSLSGPLRRVFDVFSSGLIDLWKVRVFDHYLGHLPDDTIDQVLDRILDQAPELTTGQMRARLTKLVLEADPDGSASSFEAGLADRKVMVTANPDHTANFGIYSGRPEDVVAARDNVERIARSLKTGDEERTIDQIRHDVALDLLAGQCNCGTATNTGGGGRVNVTVPAETLAGLSDAPGDLDGYGPVFAEIARKTVRENVDGEWRFVVTDNGRPVATGTLARRPTASQRRQITAEHPKCVMVGCREDAWDCDLDHRRPSAAGGPTHNDNLGPLCRFHHMTRHHTDWKLERRPNGDHQWTSPLGHTYIRKRDPPD